MTLPSKIAASTIADRRSLFEPIGLAIILLATFVAYWPAMNGGVVWDDNANLTRPELQSLHGLYRIWFDLTSYAPFAQYYPLVHSVFWVEHKLWGDAVLGYHLINVLWHSLSVTLVYRILLRLKIPGALLAAAIFALHPVMVESIAWITEQKNALSGVFYLCALLVYLQFDETRLRRRYCFSLGLFALALLSKTATVVLPVAILVILWWQRGTLSWRRDVVPIVPFFLLGIGIALMTIYVERELIGAKGETFHLTLAQHILVSGRIICFYLFKLLWPANLLLMYARWTIDPSEWWQWIFPVAVLATTFVLWTIRNRWRAPLAAWLYYCASLFPVLGFFNVYFFNFSFVADHFQYLASMGMIALVAAGIAQCISRLEFVGRFMASFLCVIVVGTLAALTWHQSKMYTDNFTLYGTMLAGNPDCWMAHSNLGDLFLETNPEQASAHYQAALRLRPEYPEALSGMAYIFMQSGRTSEAIASLEHALRIKPDYAAARNNLAAVYFTAGDMSKAAEQILLALQLNPDDAKAHARYGIILSRAGKTDDAIAHYKEAVRISPSFVDAHKQLAELLRTNGKLQEAIEHYQAALEYEPEAIEIYANLAAAFASLNLPQQAMETAAKGIETARARHQEEKAKQFEEWLRRYQEKLHRAGTSPVPK